MAHCDVTCGEEERRLWPPTVAASAEPEHTAKHNRANYNLTAIKQSKLYRCDGFMSPDIAVSGRWSSVNRACTTRTVAQLVFFFQAEDGIRDLIVTGVQTCAL